MKNVSAENLKYYHYVSFYNGETKLGNTVKVYDKAGVWPTLSTMILMSSIGVFTADGPLLLFTQGQYKTMTLNFWIFGMTTGIGAVTDYEYASAVGLIFTILGLPIVFAVNKILGVTKEY